MRAHSLLASLLLIGVSVCNAQVNMIVNKGPFASVPQASLSEDKVNFWDNDPVDDRACTESFAAMELIKYLPKATNIKPEEIRFVGPNELPKSGMTFLIGSRASNSLINNYDLPKDVIFNSEQSYYIRSFKDKGKLVTIIEGADRIGTLYGVYRYLEELGVKFIGLGEKGTIVPDYPVDIPENIVINENPSYLTRGFYAWGDRKVDNDFFYWMARNKLNYWTAENQPVHLLKKLGMKLIEGGHIIQAKVFEADAEYPYNHPIFKGDETKPVDPYEVGTEYTGDTNKDGILSNFEAHPEWYGMKDGQRTKIVKEERHGLNFCTSNKDARKEFTKRITQSFIDGEWKYTDIFNFWTFDGSADQWCTCDKCKADSSYTNRMFLITYDILKEVEKARQSGKLNRRVEICNSAYLATLEPPTKPLPSDYDYENSSITFFPIRRCYVHSFADPACTEINQWQLKAYQGWTLGEKRNYKGSIFIGEYYNVSQIKSLPVVFTKIMAEDIPWYYRSGALHFNYMHTPDKKWGTWTLNQYLMGKLLWDINADAKKIVNNYFKLYYPTTCNSTRKFYEQLETASANIKALKHSVGTSPDKNYSLAGRLLEGDLFELDHMHYNEYHPLVNDGPDVVEMIDAMELAKKYLEQSLIDCKNVVEQQRLLEDEHIFEYGYAMYQYIFHMIRTSVFHKGNDKNMAIREFAIVEKYANQLKNMIDVVQVSSDHANATNGFEATNSVEAFNKFKRLYGK